MGKPDKKTKRTFPIILRNGAALVLSCGCALPPSSSQPISPPTSAGAKLGQPSVDASSIQQVGSAASATANAARGDSFSEVKTLSADAVVEQVLARNPTLAQMAAAWQAATAKIPQATSWEDPMLMGVLAPASL